jgi:hypothetical protein
MGEGVGFLSVRVTLSHRVCHFLESTIQSFYPTVIMVRTTRRGKDEEETPVSASPTKKPVAKKVAVPPPKKVNKAKEVPVDATATTTTGTDTPDATPATPPATDTNIDTATDTAAPDATPAEREETKKETDVKEELAPEAEEEPKKAAPKKGKKTDEKTEEKPSEATKKDDEPEEAEEEDPNAIWAPTDFDVLSGRGASVNSHGVRIATYGMDGFMPIGLSHAAPRFLIVRRVTKSSVLSALPISHNSKPETMRPNVALPPRLWILCSTTVKRVS